jgi:hypothetical protein
MLPITGVDCHNVIQKHWPIALDMDLAISLALRQRFKSARKKVNSHPIASLVDLGPIRVEPVLSQNPAGLEAMKTECENVFRRRVHLS